MKRLFIGLIAIVAVVASAALVIGHKNYGGKIRQSLLKKADGEAAPVPLTVTEYEPPHAPSSSLRTIRVEGLQFGLPIKVNSLLVNAVAAGDLAVAADNLGRRLPVSVKLINSSGKVARTFTFPSAEGTAETLSDSAAAFELQIGSTKYSLPTSPSGDLLVECENQTPKHKFYINSISDAVGTYLHIGVEEFYREGLPIGNNVVKSGLMSCGMSEDEAKKEVDSANGRLASLCDEALFLRILATSEADLLHASNADQATEIGLLLGRRWLDAHMHSLKRIGSAPGHIYIMRRGDGDRHEYFAEGFAPDGKYRWDARFRFQAESQTHLTTAEELDFIDEVVCFRMN